jgi:hypothetical protein
MSLRRVKPGKTLVTAITSEDLIGCKTHFWGGRTVPCETPNCKACAEGVPWRWHAYIACYDPGPNEHWLLELTAPAAQKLLEYRSIYGTLRGCKLRAHRANFARNSRLLLETSPLDLTKITLPAAPHLERCMAIIWNLPLPAIRATGQGGLADAIDTLSDVADASRCLPIGQYAEALAHRFLPPPGNGDEREGA